MTAPDFDRQCLATTDDTEIDGAIEFGHWCRLYEGHLTEGIPHACGACKATWGIEE
jgi:hypothetical protein